MWLPNVKSFSACQLGEKGQNVQPVRKKYNNKNLFKNNGALHLRARALTSCSCQVVVFFGRPVRRLLQYSSLLLINVQVCVSLRWTWKRKWQWKRSDCPNDLFHYLHLLSVFTSTVSTAKSTLIFCLILTICT